MERDKDTKEHEPSARSYGLIMLKPHTQKMVISSIVEDVLTNPDSLVVMNTFGLIITMFEGLFMMGIGIKLNFKT